MSNPLHSEQQYLDIAAQERALLDAGSCLPLNARRDQAAEVLRMLYQRAYDDPEAMHDAPHHMPIGRPDEVKAARHPILRWRKP